MPTVNCGNGESRWLDYRRSARDHRFADDSSVERRGFELPVPFGRLGARKARRRDGRGKKIRTWFSRPQKRTASSNPLRSSKESVRTGIHRKRGGSGRTVRPTSRQLPVSSVIRPNCKPPVSVSGKSQGNSGSPAYPRPLRLSASTEQGACGAAAPRDDPGGVFILEFRGKQMPYVEMASFTGRPRATGVVCVRGAQRPSNADRSRRMLPKKYTKTSMFPPLLHHRSAAP
jgi:hypothetical protein